MSIHGIILCGGEAKRFNGEIKGLLDVPVGSIACHDGFIHQTKKLIEIQIEQLFHGGVDCIWLATRYGAWQYRKWLSEYKPYTKPINIIDEYVALGTGGAIRNAIDYIQAFKVFKKDTKFIVYNGDIIHNDWDIINKMLHKSSFLSGKNFIACYQVSANLANQYGQIEMNKNGKVLAFKEKQKSDKPVYINAGIYMIDSRIFKKDIKFSIEYDYFTKKPKLNYGIPMMEFTKWIDVGTPERYQELVTNWKDYR